uniref:Uncharacterized protein n=1 Tax=Plectus sambesii TaxID=2011161 RepID=A0A914X908_9BILA
MDGAPQSSPAAQRLRAKRPTHNAHTAKSIRGRRAGGTACRSAVVVFAACKRRLRTRYQVRLFRRPCSRSHDPLAWRQAGTAAYVARSPTRYPRPLDAAARSTYSIASPLYYTRRSFLCKNACPGDS